MRKIRMLETDKVVTVSNNIAFGLVDSGQATYDLRARFYRNIKPQSTKKYRTR